MEEGPAGGLMQQQLQHQGGGQGALGDGMAQGGTPWGTGDRRKPSQPLPPQPTRKAQQGDHHPGPTPKKHPKTPQKPIPVSFAFFPTIEFMALRLIKILTPFSPGRLPAWFFQRGNVPGRGGG